MPYWMDGYGGWFLRCEMRLDGVWSWRYLPKVDYICGDFGKGGWGVSCMVCGKEGG